MVKIQSTASCYNAGLVVQNFLRDSDHILLTFSVAPAWKTAFTKPALQYEWWVNLIVGAFVTAILARATITYVSYISTYNNLAFVLTSSKTCDKLETSIVRAFLHMVSYAPQALTIIQ